MVKGSRESGLYGISPFRVMLPERETKPEPESDFALAGWYVQDHTLEISGRFRLVWGATGTPEVVGTRPT